MILEDLFVIFELFCLRFNCLIKCQWGTNCCMSYDLCLSTGFWLYDDFFYVCH